MTLLPVLAGPALLVGAGYAVTVIAPATAETNTVRTEVTREYTVGGEKGRDLYAGNGCVYCHSLQRRDAFGDAGLGPAASSDKEDLNDRPAMLGAARYGPDLSCVGDRVPGAAADADKDAKVEAMIGYLQEPATVHKGSTMPSYRFLKHDDLRRLATYLVEHSCGEAAE
jgi:cbb3-type cytochrome oxidase cytochrome c subunit